MRELVVVLADLYWNSDQPLEPADDVVDDAARPAVARRRPLRFAATRPLRGGWRSELARALGLGRLHGLRVGDVLDAGWLATPVVLEAGLTDVRLPSQGLLALDPAEQQSLIEDFDRAFATEPVLRLEALAPDLLALHGLALETDTDEPARWLGMTLHDALPGGADGAALRAVVSEIEMWLHGWSGNERRRARGLPPVAGLWLWGREPLVVSADAGGMTSSAVLASPGRLWSAPDAFVAALARQAGIEASPLPPDAQALLDADADSGCAILKLVGPPPGMTPPPEPLLVRASRWLDPLFDALASGSLGSLAILANDRAVRLESGARLKFWRPARTWLEALK